MLHCDALLAYYSSEGTEGLCLAASMAVHALGRLGLDCPGAQAACLCPPALTREFLATTVWRAKAEGALIVRD